MTALGVDKTVLSRLLAMTKSISRELITAIGPAPKTGRPRWIAFAERLAGLPSRAPLDGVLVSAEIKSADSDRRFALLFDAMAPKRESNPSEVVVEAASGERIAVVERSKKTLSVVVDVSRAGAFGEYVAAQLPELYRQFQSKGAA